jgi:hypothetical protein
MPEPLRIGVELLAPVILAGMPLPAGCVVRLGADVALQLIHQRRARWARWPRATAPKT